MCFHVRAPQFHLPQKSEPIMMIGTGTGIAPFRSFWQQRICDKVEDVSKGDDMMIFFGCRHPHHDDIYAKELQEAKTVGALTNVFPAYSRHPNQPKVSSIRFSWVYRFLFFTLCLSLHFPERCRVKTALIHFLFCIRVNKRNACVSPYLGRNRENLKQ